MEEPGPHRVAYAAALFRIRVVLAELADEARGMVADATSAVAGAAPGGPASGTT